MAINDWTNIPDIRLTPGKPGRAIDMMAMRDNFGALAEGHDDAPRIQPAALGTLLGVINIPNSVGTAVGLTGLDGKSVLSFGFAVGVSSGALQMRKSTDNGATWSGWGDLIWTYPQTGFVDYLYDLTSGRMFSRVLQITDNAGNFTPGRSQAISTNFAGGPVNAIQFRNNTAVKFAGPVPVFGLGRGGAI